MWSSSGFGYREAADSVRILLVEDEPSAARLLAKGLGEQSYAVDVAHDGVRALELVAASDYDLVILDVMLPRKDGLTVCRELRKSGHVMPILMLTARDAIESRVSGLDCGADDYLVKPFDFREVLARIRALLRRAPALQREVIRVADLTVDTRARRVTRGGRRIELTAKEYSLIEYLARRAGDIVGRDEIAEHVWDQNFDPLSNLIEVYIRRLRRKIDDAFSTKLLSTKRGLGYMLSPEADDQNH
jgi:two-component system copper resistance phosphate regulon response regulator CusR